MAQVTGKISIRVDGQLIDSLPGATLNTGGVKREAKKGDNGVVGYSEEVVEPMVECTVAHTKSTDLTALNAITDSTITFECDTGTIYYVSGAFLTEPCALSKGEVQLKFAGISCEEVKAG
jgi:hypothetical protein